MGPIGCESRVSSSTTPTITRTCTAILRMSASASCSGIRGQRLNILLCGGRLKRSSTSPDAAAWWWTCSTALRALPARTKKSRSEEHTSELQSHLNLVCRLLLEKKKEVEHM